MSPTSFEDLDKRQRMRVIARSAARILLLTTGLIVLYAVLPVPDRTGAGPLAELSLGLVVFAGLLAWQVRMIIAADHPELRAAEALAVAVPVVIIVFAFTYLALWRADHASFSAPLDRVGAMYFTVTVISTVGFGDIVARSDAARILVTFQILLDLVLLVGIVRTVLFAAQVGVRRQQAERHSAASARLGGGARPDE
jgi:voltage-gated potassium channel